MYYVYEHFDPDTEEVVYVGMGKNDRAWMMGTIGKGRTHQRAEDHLKYLQELINKGYTPDQWVRLIQKNSSKKSALLIEKLMIESFSPRFNKNSGPNRILSGEKIAQIKASKDKTYAELGREFGVSSSTIYRIIKNIRNYKEV